MISRRGFLTWPLTLFGCGVQQNDETVIVDGIVLEDGMHYIKAQRDKTHTSGWRIWIEPEPRLTWEQVNPHHHRITHRCTRCGKETDIEYCIYPHDTKIKVGDLCLECCDDQINPPHLLVVDDPGFVGFGRVNDCFIEISDDWVTQITTHHKPH